VLAALRDVLYLGFDGGDVLPVEGPGAVGLPTALRLAEDLGSRGLEGWGVAPGDEVTVGGGEVRLAGAALHAVRLWRPARVRTTPARVAGPRRLGTLVAGAAARLGLGPGLTPAADDELCGLLLVAHAAGVRVDLRDHLSRTTDLSASLVRAAAEGYAVAPAVRVVDAGTGGRGVPAADRDAVLALGDTSGAALLAGIDRGLEALRLEALPDEELHEGGRTVA
jgi:hypothetical protein